MTPELPNVFAALSDPTRFAIVEQLLTKGDQTVGHLAEPHDMSSPAISRHLKVLESVGLIERRIEKQWRVCSLQQECFTSLDSWLRRYRDFWERSFDRLDKMLAETTGEAAEDTNSGEEGTYHDSSSDRY